MTEWLHSPRKFIEGPYVTARYVSTVRGGVLEEFMVRYPDSQHWDIGGAVKHDQCPWDYRDEPGLVVVYDGTYAPACGLDAYCDEYLAGYRTVLLCKPEEDPTRQVHPARQGRFLRTPGPMEGRLDPTRKWPDRSSIERDIEANGRPFRDGSFGDGPGGGRLRPYFARVVTRWDATQVRDRIFGFMAEGDMDPDVALPVAMSIVQEWTEAESSEMLGRVEIYTSDFRPGEAAVVFETMHRSPLKLEQFLERYLA